VDGMLLMRNNST